MSINFAQITLPAAGSDIYALPIVREKGLPMGVNWHTYYNDTAKDWFYDFLDDFNEALENRQFDVAERLQHDAAARGVWVDNSGCFRHPDDPHKQHSLDQVLSDDWIEY